MNTLEKVLPRTIFLTVAGSHLYGTNIEGSDYDFKGVCIPTQDYYLGYLKSFEQLERQANKGHPADLTITALSKFVLLASECNPNIIELLWAPDDAIVRCDYYGQQLLSVRDRFLSKRARHRFAGYAHSQLKRIKTHRSWLLNPPAGKPDRKDFKLSESAKVSSSEMGAFEALVADNVELPSDVVTLFVRERQYQTALKTYNQYEDWKRNRNQARAGLEAKHGYDTKHGMHLMRLMRMCREILSGQGVIVRRPDAEELLAIRRGEWEYDRLVEEAERLDAECAALYETSPLPDKPDLVGLDEFFQDLTARRLVSDEGDIAGWAWALFR